MKKLGNKFSASGQLQNIYGQIISAHIVDFFFKLLQLTKSRVGIILLKNQLGVNKKDICGAYKAVVYIFMKNPLNWMREQKKMQMTGGKLKLYFDYFGYYFVI